MQILIKRKLQWLYEYQTNYTSEKIKLPEIKGTLDNDKRCDIIKCVCI